MTGVNVTGAGRDLWAKKGHILTCGYARSGKGTSILVPVFLHEDLKNEDAPSFICLDPKGENVAICEKNLRENGYRVIVINPFQTPVIKHLGSAHYNPFDHFEPGQIDFGSHVNLIVNSIILPDKHRHQNSYFTEAANRILTVYIKHMMTQGKEAKTIRTLHRWLKYSDDKREKLWDEMAENDRYDIDIEIESLAHKISEGVKSPQEVFENILANMKCFTEDVIRESMSYSDFSVKEIASNKTALFICLQPDELKDNAAWLRILISSFMRTLSREYSKDRKVIFAMDEFTTMGHLKEFEEGVGYLGQFVSLWPVIQDLGQMKTHYPGMWEGFVGNAAIKHWMVRDNFTAEYLEKRMPMTLQFLGKNPDGSPRYKEKRLMTAVEIMNCDDIIMEIDGMGKPGLLKKRPYYEHFNNFSTNPYY